VLILLDNNVPRGLARALTGHVVMEARDRGWATVKNGVLLSAAEEAGFEVLVTADKNIRYQQNLEGRKIAIVVLTQLRWGLVRKMLTEIPPP
jgi:predicted nuclease of predicted toxin-antitoxin system